MAAVRAFLTLGVVAVVLGFATIGHADVVVLFEDFDDDAAFTKADGDVPIPTATDFFVNNGGGNTANKEYWGIHDPTGSTDDFNAGSTVPDSLAIPAFTFPGGSGNYLVGENLDDPGANYTLPLSLTWTNLDISGLTSLTFSGVFAAQTGTWETDDFIRIQYRIDANSGDFTDLANFTGGTGNNLIASGFNESGSLDLSADTAGMFTAMIGATGTTLDLRILMRSNANDEEFAFDSIQVTGVPEPAAFLFGGLICGVLGLRAGGRRLFGLFRRDAA